MKYQVYAPPAVLKNYVRYFWSYDFNSSQPEILIESFADRYPRLIFQNLNGYAPIKTAQGLVLPSTYLSGVDTQYSSYTVGGTYSHVGVSFYPHAMKRIFHIDAHEFTNQLPDLHYFNATDLSDKLHEAPHHTERIRILTEFLLSHMQKHAATDLLIHDCIMNVCIHHTTQLPNILQHYNISERQLERKFKQAVGISPKMYLRLMRFEQVLSAIKQKAFDNSLDIAYHFDYADQSHFIRDFKEFSGFSPVKFMRQQTLGNESASFLMVDSN